MELQHKKLQKTNWQKELKTIKYNTQIKKNYLK